MLDQAKAKPELAGCEFILADVSSNGLPFDDDSFDRVVSSGVFYYMPRPVEALREQLRVCRPGGRVLVCGSLQPKPLLVRVLAETFNRFPTTEQYVGWFTEAGLTDVQYKHVSNPWNATQYAIVICGTKAAGTAAPPRKVAESSPVSRLRRLAYLPLALARFAVAIAAFSFLGPMQVLNAMSGMRKYRQEQQKAKAS